MTGVPPQSLAALNTLTSMAGEAMLGLVRLFKLNGDRRLIESVQRGADHLIAAQKKMETLPPDAWLMQALELAHGIGKESRYADHAIDIAE